MMSFEIPRLMPYSEFATAAASNPPRTLPFWSGGLQSVGYGTLVAYAIVTVGAVPVQYMPQSVVCVANARAIERQHANRRRTPV